MARGSVSGLKLAVLKVLSEAHKPVETKWLRSFLSVDRVQRLYTALYEMKGDKFIKQKGKGKYVITKKGRGHVPSGEPVIPPSEQIDDKPVEMVNPESIKGIRRAFKAIVEAIDDRLALLEKLENRLSGG